MTERLDTTLLRPPHVPDKWSTIDRDRRPRATRIGDFRSDQPRLHVVAWDFDPVAVGSGRDRVLRPRDPMLRLVAERPIHVQRPFAGPNRIVSRTSPP